MAFSSASVVLPGWRRGPWPRGPARFCKESRAPRLHRRTLQKHSNVSVWSAQACLWSEGLSFLSQTVENKLTLGRNLGSLRHMSVYLRLFITTLPQRPSAVNTIITIEQNQLEESSVIANWIFKNRAGFQLNSLLSCLQEIKKAILSDMTKLGKEAGLKSFEQVMVPTDFLEKSKFLLKEISSNQANGICFEKNVDWD